MSQQLVKKGTNGKHENVMPKSWIEAIKDKNTGQTLVEILQGFNMYFLSYNGNTSATRNMIPSTLRRKGLWISYVKYDGNVYTEWYAADEIDDTSWGDSSNWRTGNNTLVGDITISANGNWVINGTETDFKAVGEKGNTPLLRVANNRLQVSYDLGDTYIDVTNNPVYTKFRWLSTTGDTQANNVGRIQASTDEGNTWTNMSNDFTNNLHISRYIGVNESLPTSGIAEGTIYAKGPYYAEDDTLNDNPIYRLWVYAWKGNILAWQDNGEFTSIAAGVVQETGYSENEVMSQKAVTDKLEGQVVYSEKSTSLVPGEIYFNFQFIVGHIYKYVNKSSSTDNTLNILFDDTVIQRTYGASRLKEVTFKVERGANKFGGYYNNTDINFILYDITDSVQAKPNLLENELIRSNIDVSDFTKLFYGKYVDSDGNIQQDSIGGTANPYISEPIKLMFGDTIETTLRIWTSNYPAICEIDSNGRYIPLIKGNSSTRATYKYTADKNMSVVVTGWAETNYISKPKIIISKNIKSITNDLYNSKLILEVKEQKHVGFDSYWVNLTKGAYYKYINRSQMSSNTTNLRNGEYITQTLNAGGKNSSVLFKCENDATNIYGYFNDADRDFVIYEIEESIIEKVNSIFHKDKKDVGSITENNADKIYAMKAAVASPKPMEYAGVYLPMVMITTDIHGDFGAYMRALDFTDEHKEVQCSLMLGDFTTYELPTQQEADGYFMSHNKPVLRLVGNHEIDAQGATIEAIKERFFSSDIIAHNGEIHPDNELYWHKDIILDTDSTHKLRIIGLFQYENNTINPVYSNKQLLWLCDRLSEIDSNTHVLIASHYPFGPYKYENIYNEYFSTSEDEFEAVPTIVGGANVIEPIVDAWMYGKTIQLNNNNELFNYTFSGNHEKQFVCYVTGHEHEDAVFQHPKYPKQIDINLITTSGDSRNQVYGDLPRREGDKTRDAVTLLSYDWFNRRINLIRLGSDITKQMKERKYTSFKLP